MKLSAGILITNGSEILLGHSTGSKRYDIPKGIVESGEDVITAALRECYEEFGIKIPKHELKDLGRFKYIKGKDLYLFLWNIDKFPSISSLKCTSYFINREGKKMPEIDWYKIFLIEDTESKVPKGLYKLFDLISA